MNEDKKKKKKNETISKEKTTKGKINNKHINIDMPTELKIYPNKLEYNKRFSDQRKTQTVTRNIKFITDKHY